jgi:hypothetical protein
VNCTLLLLAKFTWPCLGHDTMVPFLLLLLLPVLLLLLPLLLLLVCVQGGQLVIADVDLEAGTLTLNKDFVVSPRLCAHMHGLRGSSTSTQQCCQRGRSMVCASQLQPPSQSCSIRCCVESCTTYMCGLHVHVVNHVCLCVRLAAG